MRGLTAADQPQEEEEEEAPAAGAGGGSGSGSGGEVASSIRLAAAVYDHDVAVKNSAVY